MLRCCGGSGLRACFPRTTLGREFVMRFRQIKKLGLGGLTSAKIFLSVGRENFCRRAGPPFQAF